MTRGTNLLDDILTIDEYVVRKVHRHKDDKIAFDLSVSSHTLERWKTKVGVRRYHVNQRRYSIIMEMRSQQKDMKEIAKALHLTVRQCRNIINQFTSANF